jgi:hypothetical protein
MLCLRGKKTPVKEKSNGISERPSAKTNDDFERIKLENDDFRHIIQTLQGI